MRHAIKFFALFAITLSLITYAANTSELRRATAQKIAHDTDWQSQLIDTKIFVLQAFVPPQLRQAETLSIYIEGDGAAWVDASTPSFDPTPTEPLALQLALLDLSKHAVYLARPCQYVQGIERRNCANRYWTNHRFSLEVITATSQAIDQLKQRYAAQHIQLIGYSGGGSVAALVAARRNDVKRLITIAGNLDIETWANKKNIDYLSGSLNPADYWPQLSSIPQVHLVGEADAVMPPQIAQAYRDRFETGTRPTVIVIPGYDHHCCWVRDWDELQQRPNIF